MNQAVLLKFVCQFLDYSRPRESIEEVLIYLREIGANDEQLAEASRLAWFRISLATDEHKDKLQAEDCVSLESHPDIEKMKKLGVNNVLLNSSEYLGSSVQGLPHSGLLYHKMPGKVFADKPSKVLGWAQPLAGYLKKLFHSGFQKISFAGRLGRVPLGYTLLALALLFYVLGQKNSSVSQYFDSEGIERPVHKVTNGAAQNIAQSGTLNH